jgi:GNAT superfamily N-acetyltransferase
MTYRIEETDFDKLSDDEIDSCMDHFYRMHREDFPSYPPPNKELRIKFLTKKSPYRTYRRWSVFDDDRNCIGFAFLINTTSKDPSYESNKHIGNIDISIDKQYRRYGLGTKILNIIIEEAKKVDITLLQIWTPNADGKAASRSWGGNMAHEHFVNKLLLKDVDWDLMNKWIEDSKKKADDVETQLFYEVPEEIIEEFVLLHIETENQAPWGGEGVNTLTPEMRRQYEKDNKDKGTAWITIITKEKNGEVSGLTEVRYNPKEPKGVNQDMTGVQDKYRGRGLGKRLKAEMLFHVRENYPEAEFISTGNAMLNEAILSINQTMGYKEVAIFHLYKIKI